MHVQTTDWLQQVLRVHPETGVQAVAGKLMAVTPDSKLHAFEDAQGKVSEVGERIVGLVDGKRSVGDIVNLLVEEFEVERSIAEAQTVQFVAALVERKVLALSNGGPSKRY
jgi:hypothetical protein